MKIIIAFLMLCNSAYAGSLRLINDSPFKLRAVIRGADGTHLGEVILYPRHQQQWNDAYGHVGLWGQPNILDRQPSWSQTPYTVLWYCMDGNEFSINPNSGTAATVTAQSGEGVRECKQPKKKKAPYPYQPQSDLSEYSSDQSGCNECDSSD